jgi:hypothetical protein
VKISTIQLENKAETGGVSKNKVLKGRLPGPRAALKNIRGETAAVECRLRRVRPSFATPATGPPLGSRVWHASDKM